MHLLLLLLHFFTITYFISSLNAILPSTYWCMHWKLQLTSIILNSVLINNHITPSLLSSTSSSSFSHSCLCWLLCSLSFLHTLCTSSFSLMCNLSLWLFTNHFHSHSFQKSFTILIFLFLKYCVKSSYAFLLPVEVFYLQLCIFPTLCYWDLLQVFNCLPFLPINS